jgi:hypothetical protein
VIRSQPAHYLISRRLVQAVLATVLLALVLSAATTYVLADRWLPALERALEAEAPLAEPDAVVLSSISRSQAAVRAARRHVVEGGAEAVVLLGRPFSPDDLAPARESRHVANLTALGVPRSKVVELYDVDVDLYDELNALVVQARQRGWRRVLFLVGRGGSRRHLMAAQRIFGAQGIQVGQVLYPDDSPELGPWWRDTQLRGRVMYNWLLLLFGRLAGRY